MDKLKHLRSSGHPTATRRYTPLSVTVNAAELRTGELRGEKYLIVDIVSLRPDIVIRPMGSTSPEFVPGDIHNGALHTFANRPVVLDHPVDDNGESVSANSPKVLEGYQFGHVFEPYYDDRLGLVLPSWLSSTLASDVGDEAESVLEDFRNAISREVSVGVYAYIEDQSGTAPDGTKFGAIWLDYDGDHLAILSRGDIGACSNIDGCGPILSNSLSRKESANMDWKALYLRSHVKLRRAMYNGEFADTELREKLDLALESSGLFGWSISNYVKNKQFTYRAYDDETGQWRLYQRGYKLDSSTGAVTLKDDIKEIIGTEPVFSNASDSGISTDSIVDGIDNDDNSDGTDNDDNSRKEVDMASEEVRRIVGLIVACGRCPFGESDQEFLESKDEEFLEGILEVYGRDSSEDSEPSFTASSTTASTTASTATPDDLIQVPRDEWNALTQEVAEARPYVASAKARDEAERSRLLADIDAREPKPSIAKDVYSKWETGRLRAYHRDLGLARLRRIDSDDPRPDYSLNGTELPSTGGVKVESIPSGLAGLRSKNQTTQQAG